MLTDLLIASLSAAFFASLVERWVDHALVRGIVSLVTSLLGVVILGYSGWVLLVISTAAAFGALIAILIGERLATPPAMVVDNRRR